LRCRQQFSEVEESKFEFFGHKKFDYRSGADRKKDVASCRSAAAIEIDLVRFDKKFLKQLQIIAQGVLQIFF